MESPESLFQTLRAYTEGTGASGEPLMPCHMPGHKRRGFFELPEELARLDVTEVDGLDDLHDAGGILLAAQQRAARLCHAEESFFLVGGSTAGVLAAICAAVPKGGKLLMARDSHRSAYHAAYLRGLRTAYFTGEPIPGGDVREAPTPEAVREALRQNPDTDAVFLVSPTYEGRIAEVEAIAEIVHSAGLALIVDEAHGAHFGWSESVPKCASQCGVDISIQSVHKTLPAPTQTALLHRNGTRIRREVLQRFLRIYQSSSPSYPLMAGIDNALRGMEQVGGRLLAELGENCRRMRDALRGCQILEILGGVWGASDTFPRQDPGKLVISGRRAGISGAELARRLREEFAIETEMAHGEICLAMFTVSDARGDFERVTGALLALDRELAAQSAETKIGTDDSAPRSHPARPSAPISALGRSAGSQSLPVQRYTLWDAWDAEREACSLQSAEGRVAAEFVGCYPPGTPILVPGEEIGAEQTAELLRELAGGARVRGVICGNSKSADILSQTFLSVVK